MSGGLRREQAANENELSEALHVSRTTLREAISFLVAQEVLEIRRGTAGGCRLTADLDQTSLYDLMLAMGERSGLSACMEPDYQCSWRSSHGGCGVHCKLLEIQRALDAELRSHSLQEILAGP